MTDIYKWSTTVGDNSNADSGLTWAEGQAPGTVNASARMMMKRVAELLGDVGGAIEATGSANTLLVTANSAFATYASGRMVAFTAAEDNTGAATLNVNSIGAKSIRRATLAGGDAPLIAGNIQAGCVYVALYNTSLNAGAGGWALINPTLTSEDGADVTDAANVGTAIHGATAKATPVDADTVPLIDSEASNVLKKVTWANVKATLKTYFDTLVQATATWQTGTGTTETIISPAKLKSGAIAAGGGAPDAVLEDQKTAGTNGGTFTSGAWRTRDLNTEVRDPSSLITLSSNEFTPTVAGWVQWSAPAFQVGGHKTRLYNVTDATVAGVGSSGYGEGGADDPSQTTSSGAAAVIANKAYRIEHRSGGSQNNNGLGVATNVAEVEVYTRVQFWRTA